MVAGWTSQLHQRITKYIIIIIIQSNAIFQAI